jgi:hypothetical protein
MRRALLAFVMILGLAARVWASDVTGKWVGSVETPNGALELTYELKAEGDALSGTVASAMGSLPITDGKVSGDTITYKVTIENSTITHEAKINEAGDEITIKATGDFGTSEYKVKRVPPAK